MDAGDVIAIAAIVVSLGSVYFARKSVKSSDRSAKAAERSADAAHALLQMEIQDRAQTDLGRRLNIWRADQVDERAWSIRLDAAVAYRVEVDTHGSHVRVSRPSDPSGPMFRNDHLLLETTLAVWDRRVTVMWSESEEPGSRVLRKPMVL